VIIIIIAVSFTELLVASAVAAAIAMLLRRSNAR
jgi:hypothetical protein